MHRGFAHVDAHPVPILLSQFVQCGVWPLTDKFLKLHLVLFSDETNTTWRRPRSLIPRALYLHPKLSHKAHAETLRKLE